MRPLETGNVHGKVVALLRDARLNRGTIGSRQEMVTTGVRRRPTSAEKPPPRSELRASRAETETRSCENDTAFARLAIAGIEMVALCR